MERKKTRLQSKFIRSQLLKLIQQRETKQKDIFLTKQQSIKRDNCMNKMKKRGHQIYKKTIQQNNNVRAE